MNMLDGSPLTFVGGDLRDRKDSRAHMAEHIRGTCGRRVGKITRTAFKEGLGRARLHRCGKTRVETGLAPSQTAEEFGSHRSWEGHGFSSAAHSRQKCGL